MTWASSGFSVVFSCFNFSLEEVEPEPKENDEIVGWHHQLNGLEFEQTPGDGAAWRAAAHGVAKSQT